MWYALRIAPYKTIDHAIRGAVVTLSDIDARHRALDLTKNVGEYADRFLAAIDAPLLITDERLRVAWANARFYAAFSLTPDETVGSLLYTIGSRRWAAPHVRKHVEATMESGKPFRDVELEASVRLSGSKLPSIGDVPMVLLSFSTGGES